MAGILRRAINSFTRRHTPQVRPARPIPPVATIHAPKPDCPALVAASSPVPRVKFGCGLRDDHENGWFRQDTGELVGGFPISAGDTLVDVGCGDGGASIFAANQGAEVIATDIDPKAIEIVSKKLGASRARSYRSIVSDSNPLPLPNESATRIVAMEVLEHVEDPLAFLKELVRIGRRGALYLIAVPDERAELIQKRIAPPSYWERPNHLRIYSHDALDRLVTTSGLTIERKTYKSFFWALWWILFWAADQDLSEPEGPILANWTNTWSALMAAPKGQHVRAALDEFMPKSQVIIARKAA